MACIKCRFKCGNRITVTRYQKKSFTLIKFINYKIQELLSRTKHTKKLR
jgi:hypothetical protein